MVVKLFPSPNSGYLGDKGAHAGLAPTPSSRCPAMAIAARAVCVQLHAAPLCLSALLPVFLPARVCGCICAAERGCSRRMGEYRLAHTRVQTAGDVGSEVEHGHDLPPSPLPGFPLCLRAAPRGSSCHPRVRPLPGSKGSAAVESVLNSWRGRMVPHGILSSALRCTPLPRRPPAGMAGVPLQRSGVLWVLYPEIQTTALVSGDMNVTKSPLPVGRQLRALSLSGFWRGTQPLVPLLNISLPLLSLHTPTAGPWLRDGPGPGRRPRVGGSRPAPGRCAGTGEVEKGRKGRWGGRESFVVLSSFVPELT